MSSAQDVAPTYEYSFNPLANKSGRIQHCKSQMSFSDTVTTTITLDEVGTGPQF